ncbi:hypothetical protein D3C76_274930 [compost metagenome]
MLGVELCVVERQCEAAVGGHQPGADDGAIRAAHGHGGACFTEAAQGQAVVVQHHIGQRRGWGQVRGADVDCRRGIASSIHLRDADGLAVGLRCVEHHREAPIGTDHSGAEHGAGGIADLDRGAHFTAARQLPAVLAEDGVADGGRRCAVWRRHAGRARHVTRSIAERDLQGAAGGLRARQGDLELAVLVDGARGQDRAAGITHSDVGTGFAFAAEHGGRAVEAEVVGCQRRLQVRCLQGGRERDVTRAIGLGDDQVLPIGQRWREADAEQAIAADGRGAKHVALGIDHANGRTHFALAGQRAAGTVDGNLGRRIRRCAVVGHEGGRYRRIAIDRGASGDHKGLAIELGILEEHPEGAIAANRRRAQGGAAGGHGDQRPDGALADQQEAIGAEGEAAWSGGFGAIRAVQRDRGGLVAGGVDHHHVDGFARRQWWVDRYHEGAVRAHGFAAALAAVRVTDDHRAARFGAAADNAAIRADGDPRGRQWVGGVGCGDGDRRGAVVGAVGDYHGHAFAIGLRGRQRHAEAAIGVHRLGGFVAVRVPHRHRSGAWRVAGNGGAIRADHHVGGQCWRRDVRCDDLGSQGLVASGVGQGHVQRLAIELRRRQRYCELAASRYHHTAHQGAVGGAHFNSRARFAGALDRVAAGGDGEPVRCGRGGAVIGGEGGRWRCIAFAVDQYHRQHFAVGLGGREGDAEGAVLAHREGAQQVAGCVAHFHGATRFALATEYRAFGVQAQALRRCRCFEVRRGHGARRRIIAGAVSLGDGQGLPVELWRVDAYAEAAVGLDHGGAQNRASRAGDGNLRTRLAGATNGAAIARQGEACRGVWRFAVRCRQGDGGRQVAGGVTLLHGQCLAVGLRRVQGDFEGAARTNHDAAQYGAVRPPHDDRGIGFTGAGDGGACVIDGDASDHLRWCGIGRREVDRACAVAQVVGGFHGQAFAIALRLVEGDVEAAVGSHRGGTQHGAVLGAHGHDRTALALPGEVDAGGIDGQARRLQRAIQVRRVDGCAGGVACGVAQYHVQFLAVGLRGGQDNADDAVVADLGITQHIALGVDDLNGGAGLAAPGEDAAIGAELQVAGLVGRGDVGCGDLGRQRAVAIGIDGDHIKHFAVGLSR